MYARYLLERENELLAAASVGQIQVILDYLDLPGMEVRSVR